MITKPTVFVLGAGASMPYGFPSGKLLIEHICEATYKRNTYLPSTPDDSRYLFSREDIQATLVKKFGKRSAENFGNALFLSNQTSIDAFLEHRTEFTEIGKLAIALFILRKEMGEDLFSFKTRSDGCYQYLFSKLNASWDDFKHNRVGFITFNYDRSLEQFLFASLQNTYNKSDAECAEQIEQIPIIHVHGALGKLRWQDPNGIPYGTIEKSTLLNIFNFDPSLADNATSQIKVFGENQSVQEFQKAFELLSQAEKVYFLGFSYHQANMTRLNLLSHPKIIDIRTKTARIPEIEPIQMSNFMGSGFRMEKAEIDLVERKWLVKIPDNTSDSLLFLRKYVDFE